MRTGQQGIGKSKSHPEDDASVASSLGTESTRLSVGSNSIASSPGHENDSEIHRKEVATKKPDILFTTVMVRNIPNNYTRSMFVDLINSEGYAGKYDLVYLPVDFKNNVALGYCFLNFMDSTVAEKFARDFSGFCKWETHSDKVCEVAWSDSLQGTDAHIERYRNSPVMHESVPEECKPMLLKDGTQIPFPLPTKRIRAPRQWPRRH
jgi:hypothetical protein